MTDHDGSTDPRQDSDFRRLGRWLLVVVIVLIVLAWTVGGPRDEPQAVGVLAAVTGSGAPVPVEVR
jgi:hypothetical protein